MHASNASFRRMSTPHQHPTSNATLCSLRGENRDLHPLRQNPPSIAESADEYSGYDDIPLGLAHPPSALTSRPTHYDPHDTSPLDDYASPFNNGHQRSLTGTFFDNCRPLVTRATSTIQQHTSKTSFPSPTKSLASFIPSRSVTSTTATTASQPKTRAGSKIFGDWFNGSSAPVTLGVAPPSPTKEYPQEDSESEFDSDSEEEEGEPTMMANIFNRAPTLTATAETTPKQQPSTPKTSSNSKTASSKFAWLLSTQKSATVPTTNHAPNYHNPSDELLNMNISQSLFPHGPVDPLAPSSFHDLLSTAEKIITRYQSSYRALSTALCDAQAEQSAQADELDEADTRIRHLKMQLDTMTARAADHEAQMQQMANELAVERQKRRDEEEARKRSLALVRGPGCAHNECQSPTRRKRTSNSDASVDSGFESECDSEAASIFSRANGAMSPTDTLPSSAASFTEPECHIDTTPTPRKPQLVHRPSTYEKVLGGMNGKGQIVNQGWGCANCEGGSQSSVWGRLSQAREENHILKSKIQKLEEGIEGALNVVDGPWGF